MKIYKQENKFKMMILNKINWDLCLKLQTINLKMKIRLSKFNKL